MTERISPRQFHEAVGVEDWRVLFGGAYAHFRTGSFAAGVALVNAIGRLADAAHHCPDIDLRDAGVTVRLRTHDEVGDEDVIDPHGRGPSFWFQQMDAPRPQRNRIHVDVSVPHDQAEARIAAALAAGGHLVTDQYAPAWWTLADAEGNEVDVATWLGRD